jgi:hypothetical protein
MRPASLIGGLTVDEQLTAVETHDLLCEGQAYARALDTTRQRRGCTMIPVGDRLELAGRDAATRVDDVDVGV